MFASDLVRYALGTMRRRRLRTALTSLGVTMAIAVVVSLLTITQGLQTSVESELSNGLGTDTLTVSAGSGALGVNDTAVIEGISKVTMAVPLIQRTGFIREGNNSVRVTVIGTDIDKYQRMYSSAFVAASGFIPAHPSNDVIIVGARVFDPGQNGSVSFPLGSTVEIVRQDASSGILDPSYGGTVTGVLNTIGPLSVGAMSDTSVYIPIEQARSFYGTDQCNVIIVKLQNDDQATRDAVTTALNERFGNRIEVSSSGFIGNLASRVFSTLDLFLVGVAGITILIAGVGIMNTMTISLIERTREIGTLKSLGLKDRKVLGIFLCEASIVGLFGGIAGTVLGFGLATLIASFLNQSALLAWSGVSVYASITIVPKLSLIAALLAVTFGVIVSVLFSLYPAWRASRLSPMEALRHE